MSYEQALKFYQEFRSTYQQLKQHSDPKVQAYLRLQNLAINDAQRLAKLLKRHVHLEQYIKTFKEWLSQQKPGSKTYDFAYTMFHAKLLSRAQGSLNKCDAAITQIFTRLKPKHDEMKQVVQQPQRAVPRTAPPLMPEFVFS